MDDQWFEWFWNEDLSFNQAAAWAVVALLLPELFVLLRYAWRSNKRVEGTGARYVPLIVGFVNGKDGKWSTSKAGVVLWTYTVAFAFLAWVLWKGTADINGGDDLLDWQYAVLLGVPTVSALFVSEQTKDKVENGTLSKDVGHENRNPVAGFRELVENDEARADLVDFQYFLFNVVLLASFYAAFLRHPGEGLPELSNTLLGLTSASAGVYVTKKARERDAKPSIRSLVPSTAKTGALVTVYGQSFSDDRTKPPQVQIDDQVLTPSAFTPSKDAQGLQTLEFTVPKLTAPATYQVRVISPRGQLSDEVTESALKLIP